jgi:uncharacterized membrane protein
MAADAGSGIQEVPDGLPQELAALTSRVAQLERMVAELSGAAQGRQRPATGYDPMQRTIKSAVSAAPAAAPPPPMPQAAAPAPYKQVISAPKGTQFKPLPSTRSLENKLGSQIFNMIGIVAILVGASWGLKLAIDRGWLGPPARVIIGLVAGAGIVLWSETFRRKGFKAFSYSLKAVGSGVLYLSLWAAFHLYQLLPAEAALIAMILVTAWNGFMAWSQDSELLAAYGLAGGFATPLLLSTGGNHETFLFLYVGAIDVATVLLMRYKPWRRLLLPAFAATVFFFIGWYSEFFHQSVGRVVDSDSWETAWFVWMFFCLFAVVSVKGFRKDEPGRGEIVCPILIPLVNAAFLSLALYSVMQDSGLHESLAWLMVVLAALYLGLMQLQATAISRAIHLACAVIFLTIAIPLKASGHTLTTAWLAEGLVLYWVATRFERDGGAEAAAPAKVLWGLSLAGYTLGLISLLWHWVWTATTMVFFSAYLGAAMVAVVALAGAAWLAVKAARPEDRREPATLLAALIAIDLVGVLLAVREIVGLDFYTAHVAFDNAEFEAALVGLAILAAVSYMAYRLSKQPEFASCASVAGVTLILFNLVAILSVEREIGALWTRSAENLQRSLAISGFLMLYGAVLLAAGFWTRSAFVRWQALVLLLFTICKVFFYDISGLSQGYRVASFLGLGVLLMGVSFAYQKDLLGLRGVPLVADAPVVETPVAEAPGGES